MVDTSRPGFSRTEPRPSTGTDTTTDRSPTRAPSTDGIVTDYAVMRRSIEAIVERSDVESALRSVDPMDG